MVDFFRNGFVSPSGNVPISIKPFTSVDLDNEKDVLDWLTRTVSELAEYYAPFRRLYRENVAVYTGGPFDDTSFAWSGGAWDQPIQSRMQRAKLNIINPIVEAHLARITSSRPHVSVMPVHSNEYKDLSASRTAQKLVEMSFRDRKVSEKIEEAARCMLVCGHAYILVDWNNEIGPLMPQIDDEIPALDEDGVPMEDEEGNPIMIRPDYKIGDVDYKVLRPDQVMEQPGQWDEKDWVIRVEMEDVYKLRERYPTVAPMIKPGEFNSKLTSTEHIWKARDSENQALVLYMYHKATKTHPEGRVIIATQDVVLENTTMPFPALNRAGKLPLVRVHDTIAPGFDLPLPMTVMESGKAYQRVYNSVNANILRNMSLAVPKWVVHSGSGVRLAHLNNTSNIVQYKGDRSMAPAFVTPPSTSPELFNYRDRIAQEVNVVTGAANIFNVPPPNTRAGVMLEHQEEQEFRRSEPLIRHINDAQADLAMIALSIMADRYDDSDERTLQLMGPGGSGKFVRFMAADLMGPFDVKFERTSALPESKQGRLNEAARLLQLGVIGMEQYKTIIGYGTDPDLATAETKAHEKQLLENDLMMRGHEINPPKEYEDHVEALKALYPLVQSLEFVELPESVKGQVIAHCMAHEMLAHKRAMVSIQYAIRVSNELGKQFPAFFVALPAAIPIQVGNPPTQVEGALAQNIIKEGGSPTAEIQQPGPDAPEAV